MTIVPMRQRSRCGSHQRQKFCWNGHFKIDLDERLGSSVGLHTLNQCVLQTVPEEVPCKPFGMVSFQRLYGWMASGSR